MRIRRHRGPIGPLVVALAVLAGPAASAASFEIDPVHSTVVFKVNHLGFVDYFGRFDEISGSLRIDDAAGSVQVEIKTASVNTGNEQRDKHLRSPDFLNAAQFPVATFKSTKVVRKDAGWLVEGDLSLHGVTRPVSIVMTQGRIGEFRGTTKTGFNGEFTIKRSDFGMEYMLEGIGDEITLMLAIEANQK